MNKDRIVNKFLDHVKIYSPSLEEGDYARILKKELEDLGFDVREDDIGEKVGSNSGNIIGYLKGTKDVDRREKEKATTDNGNARDGKQTKSRGRRTVENGRRVIRNARRTSIKFRKSRDGCYGGIIK